MSAMQQTPTQLQETKKIYSQAPSQSIDYKNDDITSY